MADHSRVERFASEQLGMVHVDPTKENIVVTKYQGKYEIFTFGKAKTKTKSNAKLRKPEEKNRICELAFCVALRWYWYCFSGVINT